VTRRPGRFYGGEKRHLKQEGMEREFRDDGVCARDTGSRRKVRENLLKTKEQVLPREGITQDEEVLDSGSRRKQT